MSWLIQLRWAREYQIGYCRCTLFLGLVDLAPRTWSATRGDRQGPMAGPFPEITFPDRRGVIPKQTTRPTAKLIWDESH